MIQISGNCNQDSSSELMACEEQNYELQSEFVESN